MPPVRLISFARAVSLGLCVSMVLESPARASPYAGSLRLVELAPAGEVLVQPVPGQTPAPIVVKDASQNTHGEGESAPVVAPTGGPWMQPQIQVLVQPQVQVQAEPHGDASPRAVASADAETASEAVASVSTETASEVVALPRVETSAADATTCPVAPAEPTVAATPSPPAPGSVVPELPPTRPRPMSRPGQFQLSMGMTMFVWSSIAAGVLAGAHHAKCTKGQTKHCDRSFALMAIPVAGPLMTAGKSGELMRGHIIVGVLQGVGLAMLLAGVVRLARGSRSALNEDGVRVGKNTAVRAGSGLTLTTRF